MSDETMYQITVWLMDIMAASILLPMVVVWRRSRHFPPPVMLLSWYVYLSLASAVGSRFLYPAYFNNNYGFNVAFNLGKIALFCAVYYPVLRPTITRQILAAITLAIIVGVIGLIGTQGLQHHLAVDISRVAQCAVLAGFALAYLDQKLSCNTSGPVSHDPVWLLSVGQLLYSAGTVTAFSLDYQTVTRFDQTPKYIIIAFAGLVFNTFLTLAFLRAKPVSKPAATVNDEATNQLANSKLFRKLSKLD